MAQLRLDMPCKVLYTDCTGKGPVSEKGIEMKLKINGRYTSKIGGNTIQVLGCNGGLDNRDALVRVMDVVGGRPEPLTQRTILQDSVRRRYA